EINIMKIARQSSSLSNGERHARSFAAFARTSAWIAALGGLAFAGNANEVKVPRTLPDMSGVRMQAQPIVKPAQPILKNDLAPSDMRTSRGSKPALPGSISTNAAAAVKPAQHAHAIDHTRMYFRDAANGAIWARGALYKSEFRSDRATFVPFFGSHADK